MRAIAMTLLLVTAFAWAGASELLAAGEFQKAYAEAISAGEYALAAKAASYYATYVAQSSRERELWFSKAEEAARKAIRENPGDAEGYFELARALGRLAQYRGILQSLSLAAEVRDNLKKALELNPNHAGAMVALAIWNLELAQKGVGWLYGASADRVIPLFEKAIALEPEEIIHRYEYARALARMGKKREALKQLEIALSLPPKDARDEYVLKEAQELFDKLLKEVGSGG